MTRYSFISAGPLTAAHAALLISQGNTVLIATQSDHPGNVPNIREAGDRLTAAGSITGTFDVETGTVKDAVETSCTMVLTAPANAHEDIAAVFAEFDLSNHTLLIEPGSAFALVYARALRRNGKAAYAAKQIVVSSTAFVATRFSTTDRATVNVLDVKAQVELASITADPGTKQSITTMFPASQTLLWYPDLASIFFANTNATVHPRALMWALDNGSVNTLFYREAVPSVAEEIEELDAERRTIFAALLRLWAQANGKTDLEAYAGALSRTYLDYANGWYGKEETDYVRFVQTLPAYATISAPSTPVHRYFLEDVKKLLVLMFDIALTCGVKAPMMEATINDVGRRLGQNLMDTGMTLKSLELENASPAEIYDALNGSLPK